MTAGSFGTVYNAGLYGRLSVLDNGKTDGDSIESQIDLMERYVAERPYLHRAGLFVDNGYSGTDFARPDWDRLMEAVKAGEINCIVVKDLSRFGRNYIETGQLLEKVFPRLGIRFISINDGYDSALLNSTDELAASLKNIVNDYYAKDISLKSHSALDGKRRRGEFVGGYAPHGYQKDPQNKNRLIVDPQTAPVIQQIYEWRAEGFGYTAILQKLNGLGIPSPGRYRFENGIITNNNKKGSALLWNRHIVKDILHNIVYLGHLAQGKSKSRLYEGQTFQRTDESEWIIVCNTHEAIIDEDLFARVQEVNGKRAAEYWQNYRKYRDLPQEENPYRKRLVCADCGTQLKLHRHIYRGGHKAGFTYICPTYEDQRENACAQKKSIRPSDLDAAVLASLKSQMDLFLNAKAVLEQMLEQKETRIQTDTTRQQMVDLKQQLSRKRSLFTTLYADYRDGVLTQDEFTFTREKYRREIATLEQQISERQDNPADIRQCFPTAARWSELIERFYHADTVTHDLVEAFIAEIKLSGDRSVSIRFAFEDEYAALVDACKKHADAVEVA